MESKNDNHIESAKFLTLKDEPSLYCQGDWTHHGVNQLQNYLPQFPLPHTSTMQIQGKDIKKMDMVGAWLLYQFIQRAQQSNVQVELIGFSEEHQALINFLHEHHILEKPLSPAKINFLPLIGMKAVQGAKELVKFIEFIGELFVGLLSWLRYPQRIRWVSFFSGILFTGYNALLIVALLALLVGIVLAYQLGVQLRSYGANIFVVDLLGIALLREFAPLLTAIIIAGRTGSSYTAQLGTMRLNEEIDALRTFGLSPIELLVLPRMAALIIALPLLTILADVFSILGGMLMSKSMLGISYYDFVMRFGKVVELKNYIIGLIKTPVFAVLIASIGCFQGFQVARSAESIGKHTTSSVVQAIFMIIVSDAAFSVLFSILDI